MTPDWRYDWIPLVAVGVTSFLAGVFWVAPPTPIWCGEGDVNTVDCTREWLLVLSAMSGGILTLVAAFIAARAVFRQTKATEDLHLGAQRAARARIEMDLAAICDDFNILWHLVDNCIAEPEPDDQIMWFVRTYLMTDAVDQAVAVTGGFRSIGEGLDALDRRRITEIEEWTAVVKRQYKKMQEDGDARRAIANIAPHIFRIDLSHWLRVVTAFAPAMNEKFEGRVIIEPKAHNRAYLLDRNWGRG